jgi:hypothetical protein
VIQKAALTVARYARILEFFINYVNIEYLIEQKLQLQGQMLGVELPVKQSYAQQYLRLFAEHHREEVAIEEDTGRLLSLGSKPTW